MGFIYHKISQGETLEGLAQRYLGSADKAETLRSINNLRFPYISDDPRAQFGIKLTEFLLERPVTVAAISFSIPVGSTVFYDPGNVLFLDDGIAQEALTVNGYDIASQTVILASGASSNWSTGQLVEVYESPWAHTTRVLQTGDTLAIPSSEGVSDPQQEVAFGTDLLVQDGRMVWEYTDLVQTSGIETAKNRLLNLWGNSVYRLLHDTTWGNYTRQIIGNKVSAHHRTLLRALVKRTFLSDPWVRACEVLQLNFDGDATTLDVSIELYAQEEKLNLLGLTLPKS